MDKKRIPREEFEKIFSKVPRLTLDLIIKNEKGILFTKRSITPNNGKWHLPGGSILFNETMVEAAKRIASEELSIEIKENKLKNIGYIEYTNEEDGELKRHSVAIAFLIEMDPKNIELNSDADEFMFSKEIPQNIYPEQGEFFGRNRDLFD